MPAPSTAATSAHPVADENASSTAIGPPGEVVEQSFIPTTDLIVIQPASDGPEGFGEALSHCGAMILFVIMISVMFYVVWMHGFSILAGCVNLNAAFFHTIFFVLTWPFRLVVWLVAKIAGKTREQLGFGLGWGCCGFENLLTCINDKIKAIDDARAHHT